MTTTTQYPPAQPQPVAQKNGAALASLILGIVSLVANLLLIPTLLGIVFGIIGLVRSSRLGRKGMAIGGIVLSVVGAVVGISLFVFLMSVIGAAANTAASMDPDSVASAPAVTEGSTDDAADAPADDSADDTPAADVPDGYKVISDDLWFKWGKVDDSNQFLTTRSATVITPNGCESLLIEANEYDEDGTNVGSTIASASNLGAGDKAKVEFSWSPDDNIDSLKINDVTCF